MFHEELQKLNPEQKKAVEHTQGRMLILAGAGSGKTGVLTMRMANLIHQGVSPKNILGLTFTNKAAAEMRSRLARFVDAKAAKEVTLCTFHSFCMKVLRLEIGKLGYTTKFTLYDEQDVMRLVNMIVRDILQIDGELPSLSSTMNAIRNAKNKGLTPEELTAVESEWYEGFTKEVYRRLLASMRAYNAVDFDNLLGLTVDLFEKFPDVLDRYQEQYRYIMIDEYQDTNPIQYRLASSLSAKYNHLCVVGDDDQSIYGWRGANVKNILEFPNAMVIKLEQNYRSTNLILRAANAVIGNNAERHDKVLWSNKGDGNTIELFFPPNEIDEADAVAKRVVKAKESLGLKWNDIAILYRSNALARQVEMALMKQAWKHQDKWMLGVPYQVFGGTEFFERKEVKDLCSYLRIISNPLDQEGLLRIINQPRRGIGEDSLDKLTSYNRKHGKTLWSVLNEAVKDNGSVGHLEISSKAHKGIESFLGIIQEAKDRFANKGLGESLKWLTEKIDYRKAIKEEVKSEQMRDFKWDNVEEFINALSEFEKQDVPPQEKSLEAFIGNMALNQQIMNAGKNFKDDKVNLMTFHSAKGLEFRVCFLVGIEDHIIPHEKSLKETGLEEERRLMYVAITRAKEHLYISAAKQRSRLGKETPSRPSRFLFEIPKELFQVTDWRLMG